MPTFELELISDFYNTNFIISITKLMNNYKLTVSIILYITLADATAPNTLPKYGRTSMIVTVPTEITAAIYRKNCMFIQLLLCPTGPSLLYDWFPQGLTYNYTL